MSNFQFPVPGLRYVRDYLSSERQQRLLATIDQQPWRKDLRRRVQHNGYRYDYKRRSVDRSMFLGAFPWWATQLADRLGRDGWAPQPPDQLIVNEYDPGQGIAPYIDCVPCFGDPILVICLGSPCLMLFMGAQVLVQSWPGAIVVCGWEVSERYLIRDFRIRRLS